MACPVVGGRSNERISKKSIPMMFMPRVAEYLECECKTIEEALRIKRPPSAEYGATRTAANFHFRSCAINDQGPTLLLTLSPINL